MTHHTIKINNKEYHLPASWQGLSEEQFISCMALLCRHLEKQDKRARLLRLLLPLQEAQWERIAPEAINDLLKLVDWFFTTPVERIVKEIKIGGQLYRFPDADGYEYTGIQYTHADAVTGELAEAESDSAIVKLASIVMISDKPYDSIEREKLLADFDKMPQWALYYCSLLFLRAKTIMLETYSPAFDGAPQGEGGEGYGLIGLFFSIAEAGIFGNYTQVCNTYIHEILYFVCYRKEQNQAAEERAIKNASRNNGANH